METGRIDVIVLLDRSGSMETGRADHEGGLRSFVRDQRRLAGDVRLTFIRFDSHDPFEVVLDGIPLEDVREEDLTLIPRGGTPLLDAVGRTVVHMEARLKEASPPPEQVVLLIITDGGENSSREYTKEKVRELITAKEQGGLWRSLYLGANVDAFAEARGLGIAAAGALDYHANPLGIAAMYCSISDNLGAARMVRAGGASQGQAYSALDFMEHQRSWSAGQQDEKAATRLAEFLSQPRSTSGKEGTTTSSTTDKPQ